MRKIRSKAGTTLVELMVSLALTAILMAMVVGVASPAAKLFVRMQKIQFAQLILDNVEDEIKAQLQDAADSIKIYDGAGVVGAGGTGSGIMLEYMNTQGYVVLMSAEGCGETVLVRGGQETGTANAVKAGRLLTRYYWQTPEGDSYEYNYLSSGQLLARAVHPCFTDKYYMGGYLALTFSFPGGVGEGSQVDYVEVNAKLYRDEARTDLLAEETFIAELRYKANRTDNPTAVDAADEAGP